MCVPTILYFISGDRWETWERLVQLETLFLSLCLGMFMLFFMWWILCENFWTQLFAGELGVDVIMIGHARRICIYHYT